MPEIINMIDKLEISLKTKNWIEKFAKHLKDNGFSSEEKKDQFFDKRVHFKHSKGYSAELKYRFDPECVFNKYHSKLITNPSQFKTFREYLECYFCHGEMLLGDITRIDLCADVKVSFEWVFERVRLKYKRISSLYMSDQLGSRTGFYIGLKPDYILIYDKAFELVEKSRRLKLKRLQEVPRGVLTRFEIRLFNNKVPIKSITEIYKLLELNPFEKLEVIEFENTKKGRQLKELSEKYGYHTAQKRLNQNNNFNTKFTNHFYKSELNQKIYEQYQSGLKDILGPNETLDFFASPIFGELPYSALVESDSTLGLKENLR